MRLRTDWFILFASLAVALLAGPFFGAAIGGNLSIGIFSGFTYQCGFVCALKLAAPYTYLITLLIGTPLLLQYERSGYRMAWPFAVAGGALGLFAIPIPLIGVLPGALTGYLTAWIYFRVKALASAKMRGNGWPN